MKRTNGEILRDLRLKNGLTMEELGKKLKRSASFVNSMEKGRKPIPEELLGNIIVLLGASNRDKEEIRKNLIKKEVPTFLNSNIINNEQEIKSVTLPVFGFASAGNGSINFEEYEEEEFILPADVKIHKGLKVIKICGDSMEPMFFNSDRVLLEPCNTPQTYDEWKAYNHQIVVVRYFEERFLKEVVFKKGVMYLYSFNEDLYPEMEVEIGDEIYCESIVTQLIKRDIRKIKYRRFTNL